MGLFRLASGARSLVCALFLSSLAGGAWAQVNSFDASKNGARPGSAVPAAATRNSLPNTTPDLTPSRGIGPFDARTMQEWREAAETLCQQSRFAEAEKLFAKLLEEREHSLGLNSPELVQDLNDLGRVNFAQMKYGAAAAYYERALQILETTKGRQSIETVAALDKLARLHQAEGKYGPAEQYSRRAVATIERNRADSPELAPELIQLADIMRLQNQHVAAEPLYKRAIRMEEATRGAASVNLLPALEGLAESSLQMGKTNDAENAWRRSLAVRESFYGPNTLEAAEALDYLGKLYFDQKKYPEAAYCYERTSYIRSKVLRQTDPQMQLTLQRLADVYRAQGRQADADSLVRARYASEPSGSAAAPIPGKDVELAIHLSSLAALLASRERNVESESLYKVSINLLDRRGFVWARRPSLNPADPPPSQLADILDQYAALLKKMRKKGDSARMEARIRMLRGGPVPGASQGISTSKKAP